MQTYHIGIDVGSTTIKTIVLDNGKQVVFKKYERHNAMIQQKILDCLHSVRKQLGACEATINITGSVGMGVAEALKLPFIQEVVAATRYIGELCPNTETMIDIGGEDAKVVLFRNGKADDLRMNGNCAGGTGAFIDQMAVLLNVPIDELNTLAMKSAHIYPIASRCGVFCKTDIQNLIAKNATKEDIAASIFHAVAVQTVMSLAHGYQLKTPMLFIGGPLTFIPALRQAFLNYLHINESDIIMPDNSQMIPAWGCALSEEEIKNGASDTGVSRLHNLDALISRIEELVNSKRQFKDRLEPIFKDNIEYELWKAEKAQYQFKEAQWREGQTQNVYLGIDSGSTTTKIVALDENSQLLFSHYHANNGNPIQAVERGLKELESEALTHHTQLRIIGSCSTGYGEDLIRAAFQLNKGIIETMAHYMAAKQINPSVSFILDIGGQDMKAIFIDNGTINRIEINEACSSGCGSFIETFAKSLGYQVANFANEACEAGSPCDLGTRCTVFMNSKVKQCLREGATIQDIAAGLSYSVIKNCLYKVLKLKNTSSLGKNIVVQGGTMRNDAIVRAFEKLTGTTVFRSNAPELMGALGCALYVRDADCSPTMLTDMLECARYTTKQLQCRGCENNCLVNRYTFTNGNRYYSGNRCEKVFTNRGENVKGGLNAYTEKLELTFNRTTDTQNPEFSIGIPRALNMFEEYPFWYTLFTSCGIQVVLSSPSTYTKYEIGAQQVMSDNICFPAKLMHSHINYLIDQDVDRIFIPFVVFEHDDGHQNNSFNCPIVSGYSQVIKSVQNTTIPIDSPVISFKEKKTLQIQVNKYLESLGIDKKTVNQAFRKALAAQEQYEHELYKINEHILHKSIDNDVPTVMLAGRPYHTDPLIQHKLSDIVAAMGVNVITDDIIREIDIETDDVHFISQWAYPNRILKAAKWAATQPNNIMYMQMTSFGCGPDAFLLDEVRDLLKRYGSALTLLKIDDVNNIGSLKLRVRSALDSMKLNESIKNDIDSHHHNNESPFITTPVFGKEQRKMKIVAPFFTPFISPLIPAIVKLAGYDMDILPLSNADSADMGLKYANNEVCYPATLVVGDIIKAFKDGSYDPTNTAVAITQTGGQCRASNYISLIKKALVEAGYKDVPVISLSTSKLMKNNQPGFKVNWLKIMPITIMSILFSDCLAKLYYASIAREKEKGAATKLRQKYLNAANGVIARNKPAELIELFRKAVSDFSGICSDKDCARVGIVGEIYLKFHPFAQKDVTRWMIEKGIEVAPPLLIDFFMQSFVNTKIKNENHITKPSYPKFIIRALFNKIQNQINRVNDIGTKFKYFEPFHNIFDEAENAKQVIDLQAQFGEGWLLPAEIIGYVQSGVSHVVSLQPFGCIANQIVSKGIANRLKKLYPQLNLLSLDFDSGVSDVNISNRMLLFVNDLKTE